MASPTAPTTNVKYLPRHDDTDQRLLVKIAAVLTAGLGLAGADVVSDTAVHSGNYVIVHALTDVVFAAGTTRLSSSGSLSGITLKAGDRVYGPFTAVQLTSGTAELYKATLG